MLGHCISHGADVDGLVSAFLVKLAEEGKGNQVTVVFADYEDYLQKISEANGDFLYVCDLGVDPETETKFLAILEEKARSGKYVTYVDHHPDDPLLLSRLSAAGINVVHSPDECAGVLTYRSLKGQLPRSSAVFAAYAAISDHLERGPLASELLRDLDTLLVYFEASTLSLAIDKDDDLKKGLLDFMKSSFLVHEYPGVLEAAIAQLKKVHAFLGERHDVKVGKKYKWAAAYVDFFPGRAASLMIQSLPVDVAVAYRRDEDGSIQVSFRCSADFEGDLGRLAHDAATAVGGSGGGHRKASGARVAEEKLKDFLNELEKILRNIGQADRRRFKVTRFWPPIFSTFT